MGQQGNLSASNASTVMPNWLIFEVWEKLDVL
jgi:hypothetical protein